MSNHEKSLNNKSEKMSTPQKPKNNGKAKKKRLKLKVIFGGAVLIPTAIITYVLKDDIADLVSSFGKKIDVSSTKTTDINSMDLLAFSETIPLDEDGIISITYPIVDRTYSEAEDKFSLPNSYDYVYIGEDESPVLNVVDNLELEPDNIISFSFTEGYPTDVIGVKKEYANFLESAGITKTEALGENNPNNSRLVLEEYEVPNVYSLPAGFKLYCEDEEINNQALLAYIAEDGTNVYVIPESVIDKFVVVTESDFTIIGKYNVLKDQIAEICIQYENNRINNGTQKSYR